MSKHKPEHIKIEIVKELEAGATVADITNKYCIPESTVYRWASEYEEYRSPYGRFTLREYRLIEKKLRDTQKELELVKNSPFIQDVSLNVRQTYMEKIQLQTNEKSHILCEAFDVDHATYHHFRYDNPRGAAWFIGRREYYKKLILRIYTETGQVYGAPRITRVIRRDYHLKVDEEYVRKMMRELGIYGASPRQSKRAASSRYQEESALKNLLGRDFSASSPNQKWVLDCKVISSNKKKLCLCAIEDLFARRVVAYRFGNTENGRLICATLRDAFSSRKPRAGLIIHSDRGGANQSIRVDRLIRQFGASHSYSRAHNPFDNSPAESFFSHFASEFLADVYLNHPFHSVREAKEQTSNYIENYNYKRPHEYNKGMTPSEKEREFRVRPNDR